ncbi:unnamed protein product [Musa textilis]
MDSKSSACSSPNPNPTLGPSKLMLAFRFLRALSLVRRTTPASSRTCRGRRIERAAYASMAYSAGASRAWSRAVLRRLHHRARRRAVAPRRLSTTAGNRAEALRRLVPGGAGMDYCTLLEETADYIKCLSMQVELMQGIVDSASSYGP